MLLIDICKDDGNHFWDILLHYKLVDIDVIVSYLNFAMTSFAIVRLTDKITFKELSVSETIFEEAFAILLLENNFDQWLYFSEKVIVKNKVLEEDKNNTQYDESDIVSSIVSLTDNNNYNYILDLLHQQNDIREKTKSISVGK